MADPTECVLDTNILQKANAPLDNTPNSRSMFARRLALLVRIHEGQLFPLHSPKLVKEYEDHVQSPRNEFVKAFLEIVSSPDRSRMNWHKPWKGDAAKARHCRYPKHDDHVLRTAITGSKCTIYTEDAPMLASTECVYRSFDVRIKEA